MNENSSYFSALNESVQRLEKIKNAFVSPQFNQLSIYLQNNALSVVKSNAVNSLINLSDNITKIVNKTNFTPFIKIFNDTVISIKYIQLLKEIKWPIFLINDAFLQEQIMSACENKIDEKATSNIITSYFTDDVLDIMEDDWTSCSLINEQRIPILKEAILMHRNSYYYASTSILMCQIYGIASDIINLAKDNGLELNDENKNILSEQYNIDKKNIDKEKGKLIQMTAIAEKGILIWDAIASYLKEEILCSSESQIRWETQPLRNKICHGDQLNFGTKEHSLKAILTIDMLIQLIYEINRIIELKNNDINN